MIFKHISNFIFTVLKTKIMFDIEMFHFYGTPRIIIHIQILKDFLSYFSITFLFYLFLSLNPTGLEMGVIGHIESL